MYTVVNSNQNTVVGILIASVDTIIIVLNSAVIY